MALDLGGLTPLEQTAPTAQVPEPVKPLDLSGLAPLDTGGLTPVEPPQQGLVAGVGNAFAKGATTDSAGMFLRGLGANIQRGAAPAQAALQRVRDLAMSGKVDEARQLIRTDPAFTTGDRQALNAELSDILEGNLDPSDMRELPVPGMGKTLADNPILGKARQVEAYGERQFPVSDENKERIPAKLAAGLGTLAGSIAVGLASGPAAPLTTPFFTAMMGSGEAQQRAEQFGATEQQQMDAAAAGLLPGLIDVLPVDNLLKPFARMAPWASTRIKAAIYRGIENGVLEAGTEYIQQFVQNVIAKTGYNPDQSLLDGTLESLLVGGFVGKVAGNASGFIRGPELPEGEREKELKNVGPPSADDQNSPIPTSMIQRGREQVAGAVGSQAANDIMARNGLPPVGTQVAIDLGDGRTVGGTITDGFRVSTRTGKAGLDGVRVRLDDGTEIAQFIEPLTRAGGSIKAAQPVQQPAAEPGKKPATPQAAQPPAGAAPPPAGGASQQQQILDEAGRQAAAMTAQQGWQPLYAGEADDAPITGYWNPGTGERRTVDEHAAAAMAEASKPAPQPFTPSDQWQPVPQGTQLPPGLETQTGPDGTMQARLPPGSKVSQTVTTKDQASGATTKTTITTDAGKAQKAREAADKVAEIQRKAAEEKARLAAEGAPSPDGPAIIPPEAPTTGAEAPAIAAPAASSSPVTSFTTSKGSTYTVSGESTQRTKSLHQGHDPNDVGLKEPSERTVYLDDEQGRRAGMHGSLSGRKAVMVVGDEIVLAAWNEKEGRWGVSPGDRFKFSTTPEVGKKPLELWQGRDESGARTYSKWHAGNDIVEVGSATPESAKNIPDSMTDTPAGTVTVEPKGNRWNVVVKANGQTTSFAGDKGRPFASQAEAEAFAASQRQQLGIAEQADPGQASPVNADRDGTRAAPIVVETPADLAIAEQQVRPDPTDPQKEPGNYGKIHVRYRGLDLSIENKKGSVRTGTSPSGQSWSVTMPANYGYIKRTVGKDGDHVDAYLGDTPASERVFVVDQINPDTGAFDEHKAFLGFKDRMAAVATYARGFSDGSAGRRRGAVTEMSIEEFKRWLAEGDTTKPLAYAGRQQAEPNSPEIPDSSPAPLDTSGLQPVDETPPQQPQAAAPEPVRVGRDIDLPASGREAAWWRKLPPAQREALIKLAGWATAKGDLNAVGRRVLASEWDKVPEGTRKTLLAKLREARKIDQRSRGGVRRGPYANKAMPLIPFLASSGGIYDAQYAGEFQQMGLTEKWVPGFGPLIRKAPAGMGMDNMLSGPTRGKNRISLDSAVERAIEAGYLPEGSTPSDLLEALDEEMRGRPRYAYADLTKVAEEQEQAQAEEGPPEPEPMTSEEAFEARLEDATREIWAINAADGYGLSADEIEQAARYVAAEDMSAADAIDWFLQNEAEAVIDDLAENLDDDIPFDRPVEPRGEAGGGEQDRPAAAAPEEGDARDEGAGQAGGEASADRGGESVQLEPDAFRKLISKLTLAKGVQVFGRPGGQATYDPLTDLFEVGNSIERTEANAKAIAALRSGARPHGWRDADVSASLDSGDTVTLPAGEAADALAKRLRQTMSLLECLG